MLAALINVTQNLGYPLLFVLVGMESTGIPVPGETALIFAGLAASSGRLDIAIVIVVAAGAAIVGDNIGFQIGRRGGRAILERPGRFERERRRVLEIGDPFFERHGGKAVFFGRWIAGLRVWAAWLAGASGMRWRTFLLFNAAGGISWAISVGLAAYFGGRTVENIFTKLGLYGVIAAAVAFFVTTVILRRRRRRRRSETP